ncbi:MAG: hypothetical protein PHR61_04055 [Candidatus Absconditabacteria bacterium]|nr:hypothetical protein [Candidatus Absconditabacteria bacterium]
MKKTIFVFLSIICFTKAYAQKQDLLQTLITNIQSKDIVVVGCLVNEEYPEESMPFVKKMAVETSNLFAFIMSDAYLDESKIICRDVIIFDRTTKQFKEFVLNGNQKNLDELLKKQQNKEFQFICGITNGYLALPFLKAGLSSCKNYWNF